MRAALVIVSLCWPLAASARTPSSGAPLTRAQFGPVALGMRWQQAYKALRAAGVGELDHSRSLSDAVKAAPKSKRLVPFRAGDYRCRRGINRAYYSPRARARHGGLRHSNTPVIHCASSFGWVSMRFTGKNSTVERIDLQTPQHRSRAPGRALLAQVRAVLGKPDKVSRHRRGYPLTLYTWFRAGKRIDLRHIDMSSYYRKPSFSMLLVWRAK